MNFKTLIAAGATVLFAGTLFTAGTTAVLAAKATPPGGHLNIIEVFADVDAHTIEIWGEDFDFVTRKRN